MAKTKIVKKKTNTFNRFESDKHVRMDRSWRRPRGIDCRVRRKWRGAMKTPKIGYGSNNKTRHLLPSCYLKKFVVNNVPELDCLLMNNDKYAAEIAGTVGAVKRISIVKRAKELGIKVVNAKSAKTKKLEDKKNKL